MFYKEPEQTPQACVIWMHGLGADAQDMAGLAEQIRMNVPVRHVFLNAPIRPVTLNNQMTMRAWYDIYNLNLNQREDKDGILDSEREVREVMALQCSEGFSPEQIFLAGFSQGGAMALFTGIRTSTPLGGIVALSAYVPLASEMDTILLDKDTPIFVASGEFDNIVLPQWTQLSVEWLRQRHMQHVSVQTYPIEHAVSYEELQDITSWFEKRLSGVIAENGGAQ